MESWLAGNESAVRLGVFLSILIVMMTWELAVPRRRLSQTRRDRWTVNLSLVVINSAALRLIFSILAVGTAEVAHANGWGLLNVIALPGWLAVPLCVIALDCVIYGQHVVFHAVSPLWRLHMMHHSDLDFDATTGVRFHPIEIIISIGIKMAAVVAIGAPPVAVILFEILLNGTSVFNHGNVRMPKGIDRFLRLFIVTPDMHRVHHSTRRSETNRNFGFNFPWWDRLFDTYVPQPTEDHARMVIGLSQFREASRLRLHQLILMPLIGDPGTYPIATRRESPGRSTKP
ncbi:MAG: hypothetical protein CL569_08930 [Alphaproteobacteria bacterium]|nr:hypothetical protein [Alphaproteobacteria bacterium]|tara:strand:+ start:3382 stop:4242 length:861 start_codon:yes stop_codon:yes gene_type:complete